MRCPSCNVLNDDATNLNNGKPAPVEGDLTICFSCATIGVFVDDRLTVRAATEDELAQLDPDNRRILDVARRAILSRVDETKGNA